MVAAHAMTLLLVSVAHVVAAAAAAAAEAAADGQRFPIAIRRQSPDANEKILAEHLVFAPVAPFRQAEDHAGLSDTSDKAAMVPFLPPYAEHHEDALEGGVPRKQARALDLLRKWDSCPSNMNSCGDTGSPNKCCPQDTYCTSVPDTDVGHVACCPSGSTCGGAIERCPAGASSCAAALGGGCCIPGYICQGIGCVPIASATSVAIPTGRPGETLTSTKTTIIEGVPTVIIIIVTETAPAQISTQSSTQTTPEKTNTGSATGIAPWRPTVSSEATTTTAAPESTTPPTQMGCPTGFYGCLATHGGGCCRTDRDCQTSSCPPPPPTTMVNNGVTIVVPATNVPTGATGSAGCASDWFLCGPDAGTVAGCCPSGYQCGSASCFAPGATTTSKIDKQAPDQSACTKSTSIPLLAWCLAALAFLL